MAIFLSKPHVGRGGIRDSSATCLWMCACKDKQHKQYCFFLAGYHSLSDSFFNPLSWNRRRHATISRRIWWHRRVGWSCVLCMSRFCLYFVNKAHKMCMHKFSGDGRGGRTCIFVLRVWCGASASAAAPTARFKRRMCSFHETLLHFLLFSLAKKAFARVQVKNRVACRRLAVCWSCVQAGAEKNKGKNLSGSVMFSHTLTFTHTYTNTHTLRLVKCNLFFSSAFCSWLCVFWCRERFSCCRRVASPQCVGDNVVPCTRACLGKLSVATEN